MGVITRDEVFEYWPKGLDDSEVESRLNILYRAAKRDRLSISQTYDGLRSEDMNWELIQCLKKHFRAENYVILSYDSWIMGRLIESGVHPESLGQDYVNFWRESILPKAKSSAGAWRFEDQYFQRKKIKTGRNFATDPFCKRCKDIKKKGKWKREDLAACCAFPMPHHIIAAFSESKIWIGFGHHNPLQLAGIVYGGGPAIPIPCFSWSRESFSKQEGNDCLAPWAKSTSFGTPNYDPKQAIELFRELCVRCSSRFMRESSLHHHL